jgi:hypothetical protein
VEQVGLDAGRKQRGELLTPRELMRIGAEGRTMAGCIRILKWNSNCPSLRISYVRTLVRF